jgi:acetyl esterase/lipase
VFRPGVLVVLLAGVVTVGCGPTTAINALSPSDHYTRQAGQVYGDDPRQRLDVYRPTSLADEAPVVVFFYGNGWREAARADFEFVGSALAEDGIIVVVPDYRAYPEVSFPAFVEDGAAAVRWAMDNIDGVADGARPLYLMGHSAGAHIAAMLSLDPPYLAAVANPPPPLAGFIGLSGPYDFLPLDEGYLQQVFPEDTRPQSQPINFVTADAPRTLLVHGTDDKRVLPEHSQRLARRLEEEGVPVTLRLYDGTGHVRVVAALAPPLQFIADTLDDVVAFIRAD